MIQWAPEKPLAAEKLWPSSITNTFWTVECLWEGKGQHWFEEEMAVERHREGGRQNYLGTQLECLLEGKGLK